MTYSRLGQELLIIGYLKNLTDAHDCDKVLVELHRVCIVVQRSNDIITLCPELFSHDSIHFRWVLIRLFSLLVIHHCCSDVSTDAILSEGVGLCLGHEHESRSCWTPQSEQTERFRDRKANENVPTAAEQQRHG